MQHLEPHLVGKRHIIWDFNGTLVDDVAVCVEIIGALLTEHGLGAVGLESYRDRFHFPVLSYYRELGFDLATTPFAALSEAFHTQYRARVHETALYGDTVATLVALSQRGLTHSVLSAAQQHDLESLLQAFAIRSHFTQVYGLGDREAHSKVERGQQLLQALGLPRHELLLIGDTDHDVEVAEALGIDVLLLSGGHQSTRRLRARHTRVAERPTVPVL